jgi:hypothetical protein
MDHVYLGGKHQNYKSGLEENGQLLGSALNASLEQGLPLQTDTYSRSQMWVDGHPLESYNPAYNVPGMNDNGIIAKRDSEEADDEKMGFYSQLNPNVKLHSMLPATSMAVFIIIVLGLLV